MDKDGTIYGPYQYGSEWCEFCKSYDCSYPNYWPGVPWTYALERVEEGRRTVIGGPERWIYYTLNEDGTHHIHEEEINPLGQKGLTMWVPIEDPGKQV